MRSELLAVALASLAARPAQAEAGKPTLVVLDIEAAGASALEAQAATLGVVRGLRELDVFQVLSSDDVRQLLALERSRQLVGLEGKGGVVADMGKALGAKHVVAGSVAKTGAAFQLELRLLDTAESAVLSHKSLGPIARVDELAARLPGLAQELVGPLLLGQQGSLLVHSPEEGAEVLIDDALVASTPLKAALKLPRGTHRLQVRKDGFIAQSRSVRIAPDQLTVEDVTLAPSSDYAEAYRLRHGRLRVGAYLATAVAVGALAGAYLLDRSAVEPLYQQEFLPRQYALRGQVLESPLGDDPRLKQTWQACGMNEEGCAQRMEQLQGALQTQQLLTLGLMGIGVAAAGISTYLWLTGQDPNRYAGLVAGVSVGPAPGIAFALRL